MEVVELLKTVGLFAGLKTEQLERLAGIARPESYNDGEIVFYQGEQGDELYVVADGQFEVLVGSEVATAESTIFLGQGQIFGEMAILDYGERSANIRCAKDGSKIYVIERNALLNLCASDTDIGFVVMRNMASDLSFKLRYRNLKPESG